MQRFNFEKPKDTRGFSYGAGFAKVGRQCSTQHLDLYLALV